MTGDRSDITMRSNLTVRLRYRDGVPVKLRRVRTMALDYVAGTLTIHTDQGTAAVFQLDSIDLGSVFLGGGM